MSPPIHKDWWLAAALTSATLPTALAQPATPVNGRQTGVLTTVTQGASPSSSSTAIYVDGTRGQRLTTGPNQSMHVLFSDQSAMTLGPNSEVVIAEYRFDKKTQDGNLLVDMTKGLLRVVGGFLSKSRDTVVRTNTATVGIRGGISAIENNGQTTSGTFLFGNHMTMSGNSGDTQTITRPGFGLTGGSNGVSGPQRISSSQLTSLLNRFEQQNNPPPPPPPSSGPPPAPSPGVQNIDPDRVSAPPPGSGGNNFQPTFKDLLGSLPPPPVS
ncbi:MAG: FecR domain-containing protein [Ramlibacter sp.]|nr:FecR domain-containing protein [Ramlibacter sp.]